MNSSRSESDLELVRKISTGDKQAFNHIVEQYYTLLCHFTVRYVRSQEQAEEIVQDILVSLWERRTNITLTSSLSAYLHTAAKYRSLNYLKKVFNNPETSLEISESKFSTANLPDEALHVEQLQKLVHKAIELLPNKCRIIFDLSRNAGLTYKQIAQELRISEKTVETQISIALSKLRAYLQKYWEIMALVPLFILSS